MSKARFLADLLSADGEVKASKVDAHSARKGSVGRTDLGIANQEQLTVDGSGNLTLPGTVDGVDIAARDSVLTSTNTTAGNALPKSGGTMSGVLRSSSTIDLASSSLISIGGATSGTTAIGSLGNSAGRLNLDTDGNRSIDLKTGGVARLSVDGVTGGVIVNETGTDSDFRVESDANTHMLFVDGGNNRVNVGYLPGGSVSTAAFTVGGGTLGAAIGDTLRLSTEHYTSGGNSSNLTNRARRTIVGNGWVGSVVDTVLEVDNTAAIYNYITYGIGELAINDSGANSDFRVESDTDAYALFLNGADGAVSFGTSQSRPAEFNHPDGFAIRGDVKGQFQSTVTGNMSALLNRDGSDGDIIGLRREGLDIGRIGVSGGNNLYISGAAANHCGLTFATQAILPTTQGVINNGLVDLGASGNEFKDLWLGNSASIKGVRKKAWSGSVYGNSTVSVTFNAGNFRWNCAFNHYGYTSYGCSRQGNTANGAGGMTHFDGNYNNTSSNGGSWSITRNSSNSVTITKELGTYAGGGSYYIIVEGNIGL